VAEEVRAEVGHRGADIAVDAVGLPATLKGAVEVVRKGGVVTMVGNLARTASLPLQAVVTRELTLYGSCASAGEYPACLDMIANNVIDVDALISAVAPLSEGAAWMERLYKGSPELLKVILEP
jgi:threonine dehydrogenase-like Zn-dependent dehydrogenase